MSTTQNTFDWRKTLQLGLIGGLVGVLIALVGMVDEFDKRDIVAGTLSMGWTLLLLTALITGYFAASMMPKGRGLPGIVSAVVASAIFAVVMSVLAWLVDRFDLRQVLVNASPNLVKILTFEQGVPNGLFMLIGAGAAVGLLGGVIHILPDRIRKAVALGLSMVALLGLLQEIIQVSLAGFEGVSKALEWMFGKGTEKGLSVAGAIVVFIVVAAGNLLWNTNAPKVNAQFNKLPQKSRRSLRWLGYGILFLVIIYLPAVLGLYLTEVVNSTGLFILMGLGLNIVVGFAGLLDLGYVAFYAIGAYTVGVLTNFSGELTWHFGWNFWLALPVAVSLAVLAGVVLGVPVLNMRGDYLAIVTLGFGEIIRILALSDFLKPSIGGSQGIVNIPPPQFLGVLINNPQTLYYVIVAGAILALFISQRLRDSRLGRSWKALREDEDVAQAMGINLVATKLLAFATGAAFSGLSGSILAVKLGTIYPHSFALLISINVLALIIVGGMGSIPGVFVGGLLLAGMPELLREFAEYRLLIYGALLVVMMQVRPEGFWPEATHKRELHEAEAVKPAEAEA
ncbi:MAG: leucine/isoleucine/valine transporter permease subunit [Chloroflexi bacterium]|nr:leucine/isoleucine/valine transporter permease subunit [Chloroflexota bacterium]